jgi:hypothetical protein
MSVDGAEGTSLKANQLTVDFGMTSGVWFQDSLHFVGNSSRLNIYSVVGSDLVLRASDQIHSTVFGAFALDNVLVVTGSFERPYQSGTRYGTETGVLIYDADLNSRYETLGNYGWSVSLDRVDEDIFVFSLGQDEIRYATVNSLTGNISDTTVIPDLPDVGFFKTTQKIVSVSDDRAVLLSSSTTDDVYLSYIDLTGDSHLAVELDLSATRGQAHVLDLATNGEYVVAVVQGVNVAGAEGDSDTGISAVVFDMLGNELARFQANTQVQVGNQSYPRVAITDKGEILAAYFDEPGFNVHMELFDSDGTFLSSEVLRNGYTSQGVFHDGPSDSLLFSYGATALGENFGGTGVLSISTEGDTIVANRLPGVTTDRISSSGGSGTTPEPDGGFVATEFEVRDG